MRRVKLVIAYDGTNYHGWQLQPNGISIESVLNHALTALLREPIAVIGASRTDSGVHALGNVAVFDTENRMPPEKICFALNQRLPEDIRVQSSCEVAADWHPRKQNCVKTYEYKILNRRVDMPVGRLYTYFCYFPIDVEAMRQAALYLLGEHDFKSFCTVRTQAEETVRTIYRIEIHRDRDDIVSIQIAGSGFLYNMVRIIAGTLLRVGTGLYPPEHVAEILEAKDRQAAGPTLPAKGLTLIRLDYETELARVIEGKNKDWAYRLIQAEILEKKKAYLIIERCKEEEFDRLLARLTHQAVRNGARWVYVCNKEGTSRIVPGKSYGYYVFSPAHNMLEMRKRVACQGKGEDREKAQTADRKAVMPVDNRKVDVEERIDNQKANVAERIDNQKANLAERIDNRKADAAERTDSQKADATERREFGKANLAEKMELRAVESVKEVPDICHCLNEIFYEVPNSATLTREEVEGWLKENKRHLYWIETCKKRAGVLVLWEREDGLMVDSLGVFKDFRGLGLAKAALGKCEALAGELGKEEIFLWVSDANLPAFTLYQKTGFKVEKTISQWWMAEGWLKGEEK